MPRQYQDYEVGAGWVDPEALEQQLRGAGMRFLNRDSSFSERWIGSIALVFITLSWWYGEPLNAVLHRVVDTVLTVVHKQ